MSATQHWETCPETTEIPVEYEEDRERASAIGTIDRFCHILTGRRGHWTGTLCGLVLEPPQSSGHAPPPARCTGGHPSCPDCSARAS